MSFIVRRIRPEQTIGYTGPMRTRPHTEREAQAWIDAGYEAEVLDYTPEVKAQVREWEKEQRKRRGDSA